MGAGLWACQCQCQCQTQVPLTATLRICCPARLPSCCSRALWSSVCSGGIVCTSPPSTARTPDMLQPAPILTPVELTHTHTHTHTHTRKHTHTHTNTQREIKTLSHKYPNADT